MGQETLAEELLRRIKRQLEMNAGQQKGMTSESDKAYFKGEEAAYHAVAMRILDLNPELEAQFPRDGFWQPAVAA